MKVITLALVLFGLSQNTFAGLQYSMCRSPETNIAVCWSTPAIYLKSQKGLQELRWLSGLKFTNSDGTVLVEELADGYLLVDPLGQEFHLQCEPARNGHCH